jgi:hypothetical protein
MIILLFGQDFYWKFSWSIQLIQIGFVPTLRSRSVDSTRTWLIFAQDLLGNLVEVISRVRGNPALGSLLVNGMQITVPELRFRALQLRISTGLIPLFSLPLVGLRAAHQTSPLFI